MGKATELYVQVWQSNGNWIGGVIGLQKTEEKIPIKDCVYSALSLMPTNMLIHIYWIGGIPSDDIRDQFHKFILAEAAQVHQEVFE